jgi:hypothetical protein
MPPGESDARLEEMRDEVSGRLAEVHASLADMDAESGPARAAALLAGEIVGLLSGAISRHLIRFRPWIQRGGPRQANKVFLWRLAVRRIALPDVTPKVDTPSRMRLALARALFVKVRFTYSPHSFNL